MIGFPTQQQNLLDLSRASPKRVDVRLIAKYQDLVNHSKLHVVTHFVGKGLIMMMFMIMIIAYTRRLLEG